MTYTQTLLQCSNSTKINTVLSDTITTANLFKAVARETFNSTMPVLLVEDSAEFKKAIKLAIACKYTVPNKVDTVGDLLDCAAQCYKDKLKNKLVRVAVNIGTHVPKATSSCIEDGAIMFERPPALSSGVTSGTVDSGRWVTGSKDGKLVTAFGFLSSTYQIGNEPAMSLFERMAVENRATIELLRELDDDKAFILELIEAAAQHRVEQPPSTVSQFHKQNFVHFGGKRIVVTPLQSVNTTVALSQAIGAVFGSNGRVAVKRYAAGGAQSQNVSSLNQDLGGAPPHIKAWIPSHQRTRDVFYYLYLTKRLSLDNEQKALIARIAGEVRAIEVKGHSNASNRQRLAELYTCQAQLLLKTLYAFADQWNMLTDQKKRQTVRERMNPAIKAYFQANSVQQRNAASEILAWELLGLIAQEMKRNKLHSPIESSAFDAVMAVLVKGGVSCPTL